LLVLKEHFFSLTLSRNLRFDTSISAGSNVYAPTLNGSAKLQSFALEQGSRYKPLCISESPEKFVAWLSPAICCDSRSLSSSEVQCLTERLGPCSSEPGMLTAAAIAPAPTAPATTPTVAAVSHPPAATGSQVLSGGATAIAGEVVETRQSRHIPSDPT